MNGDVIPIERVPQIKWLWNDPSDPCADWTTEQRLKHACELASTLNHAAEQSGIEMAERVAEINLLNAKLEANEKLRVIDKQTLADVITRSNAEGQEAAKRIQDLQGRIRDLER